MPHIDCRRYYCHAESTVTSCEQLLDLHLLNYQRFSKDKKKLRLVRSRCSEAAVTAVRCSRTADHKSHCKPTAAISDTHKKPEDVLRSLERQSRPMRYQSSKPSGPTAAPSVGSYEFVDATTKPRGALESQTLANEACMTVETCASFRSQNTRLGVEDYQECRCGRFPQPRFCPAKGDVLQCCVCRQRERVARSGDPTTLSNGASGPAAVRNCSDCGRVVGG